MLSVSKSHILIRLINRIGAYRSVNSGDFDPENLKKIAMKRASLSDFGADDYQEGLSRLCDKNQQKKLTTIGRKGFQEQLISALVTRLLLVERLKKEPTLDVMILRPPLIVVGLPRSGTTFLHRLLTLDPIARGLSMWEVSSPLPGPGRDRRRMASRIQMKMLKLAAPNIDAKHYIHPDQPEECVFLLNSTFRSAAFWMMAPNYSYLEWLKEQDMDVPYETYGRLLKTFQQDNPAKRLTLKAPAHTLHLKSLLRSVPNAMIVQTHRDPVRVVNSANSLFASLFHAISRDVDIEKMAQTNLELFANIADASVRRPTEIENKIFDLRYKDLLSDPIGQIRGIYTHFGLVFDESFRVRLEEALQTRKQHRFGQHTYASEDFGMTDADISRHFEEYQKRFL